MYDEVRAVCVFCYITNRALHALGNVSTPCPNSEQRRSCSHCSVMCLLHRCRLRYPRLVLAVRTRTCLALTCDHSAPKEHTTSDGRPAG
jgi:hypothetical protein